MATGLTPDDYRARRLNSGIDKNSATYRRAKLHGWDTSAVDGQNHGGASRKWTAGLAQEQARSMQLQNEGMAMQNDFLEYENGMKRQMYDQQLRRNRALLSIADCATRNGGRVPVGMFGAFDTELGGGGSYGGSMWTGKGRNSRLRTARVRNGRFAGWDPSSYSPEDLIRMDKENGGGGFDDRTRAELVRRATEGMTPRQAKERGLTYDGMPSSAQIQLAGKLMDYVKESRKGEGKGAKSIQEIVLRNPDLVKEIISATAENELDSDGNPIEDAGGLRKKQRTPQQIAESVKTFLDGIGEKKEREAKPREDPAVTEAMGILRRMFSPTPANPDDARLVAENSRRRLVTSQKEQLINYTAPDGRSVTTNGYVLDGVAYDHDGRPISGYDFTDEYGVSIGLSEAGPDSAGETAGGGDEPSPAHADGDNPEGGVSAGTSGFDERRFPNSTAEAEAREKARNKGNASAPVPELDVSDEKVNPYGNWRKSLGEEGEDISGSENKGNASAPVPENGSTGAGDESAPSGGDREKPEVPDTSGGDSEPKKFVSKYASATPVNEPAIESDDERRARIESERKREEEERRRREEAMDNPIRVKSSHPRSKNDKVGVKVTGGRKAREGVKGSFAAAAEKSMERYNEDVRTREQRIYDLMEESKEEHLEWSRGDRDTPFRFSKQDELDELIGQNRILTVREKDKNARSIIEKHALDRAGSMIAGSTR